MTPFRWLSIRARITLGSVVIGAVVLSGVAFVLHEQIEHATLEADRSLAAGDAAAFVADLHQDPEEPPDVPAADVLVAIRTAGGRWITDSLPRDLQRVLPPGIPDRTVTLRLHTDRRAATVIGTPVTNDRGTYVVWAAHDGRAGEETVASVDRSLVIGTLLALAAFAGTAWLLTTLALRPVSRMRRTAELLSTGAVGGHLPIGSSQDEVAELARTLNAFIDRQRENAEREQRMIADASHELRTPLAALTARLELAHRASGDADALERELDAAEVDAGRLVALANTMLELSRLDEQGAPPESPAADLVTELMGSVDRMRTLAGPDADIDFAVEVPSPRKRYPVGPAAFARVVDNLVANAVAAGDTGVVVRITLLQDDAHDLVLRVVDDGPGIAEAFLPRAFDRFTRADPARRSGLGGSGLGLALVRATAERGGGSVRLANRPTGGAEADVRFPTR
ncbi:HAMP domain-containing histidine kinase [Curtobacterium sp. VKM Ac-2865]|uniref:sensor histidine kinase n=1 Tax=Curtobacterium sp. VKM Ac-2865 TaxID=2783817 RepID=UPI00188B9083|nr:HAMP domain-containing sensor histidine kinase [Curtobacterium sp. VKM Ac-2865]MBF4582738.1 HAMP domain-containing histidine kinase [Curtobacterium sp. VKM Ac-2865]